MTIDDMMKQTFDSLKVDTRIYAEFEHDGGLYSGEFKVIWIDKGEHCISLTTPNESPYGTCIGVPLKNFFSLVNISKYNKEEITMTDYGKKLEKEYHDGMVVGAIYNFIGKGTHGWKYKYRLAGFEGYGEDLSLIFKSVNNDSEFHIMANDMGGFHLISKLTEEKSNILPKPMELVKKIEGYSFDEKAFYRATNGVRHFLIKNSDNDKYEALYYGPTLDRAGMHIAFARTVGFTDVSCESAELYHDKIKCDPIMTNFKLFEGDSACTPKEIKIDEIFKKEEKLEWDIDKLKVGKAYRIRDDIDGNETDGLYTRLYETAIPGRSSIVFAVVSDKGVVGTYHVYLENLVSGNIKIYELTCRKDNDEE